MKKILKSISVLMAAAALTFTFSSCGSDGGDSNDSGSSSGSGSSSSSSTSLPKAVGKDTFSGMTVQYEGTKKMTFKNGVATVTNGSKKLATYNYSYDTEKKLIYFSFKSMYDDNGKEYKTISSYAGRNEKALKAFDCKEDYIKAAKAGSEIYYKQIRSYSYEQTDSTIEITPYYNGPITALTNGGKFYGKNGNSQILATNGYFESVIVTLPKKEGTSNYSIYGYVTKADKNSLECTVIDDRNVVGKFSVDVTVTPESGNDAKAKVKITAIDKDLTVAYGYKKDDESEEMTFYNNSEKETWAIVEAAPASTDTKTDTTTKTDTSATSDNWKLVYNGEVKKEYPASKFNPETDLPETGLKAGTDYTIDKTAKTVTFKSEAALKKAL